MQIKEFSLVLPFFPNDQVLLGEHKRGPGQGNRNGFGGGMEEEDQGNMKACAVRELRQESSIEVDEEQLEKIGVIDCVYKSKNEIRRVFVFTLSYDGAYQESEEMKPQLFHILDIPYKNMRAADEIWLKQYIEDKQDFERTFYYDENKKLVNYEKGLKDNN